jgi:D-glycero-D-manno-heptose 1,7-bisphosphate phosphatase
MLVWISTAQFQARHFLLLDRDGVINEDRPDYITHRHRFRFYPDALEALRWLHDRRIAVIVISNQSGLNRGFIAWEDFWDIHACMIDGIEAAGGNLLGAFYCPHRPDEGCSCRKPLPGLLQAAAEQFQIPLAETHFIGDRESDLLAASRAGCRGVLLDRFGGELQRLQENAMWGQVNSFGSLMEAVSALFRT